MANERQTTSAEFLVEQCELLVDYRKYLGRLLIEMTGGVVAIFAILIVCSVANRQLCCASRLNWGVLVLPCSSTPAIVLAAMNVGARFRCIRLGQL